MKLLNFVFVKRNWAVDRVKFFRRIRRIGAFGLPYSLVIFPEGTTLNPTAIAKGQAYAKVNGLPVLKHVLVPRKTGLEAAINALRQVEDPSCGEALQGVLDLTIGYSGLKATQIPEEHYGIGSMLFSSHAPKEVHILPSCIPLKDIPEDSEKFGQWLNARFKRKEELLASFFAEGRFPGYQARPVTIVPRNALWRLLLMLFCVHALLAYLFFFPRK